jgi:hypothetical protein
MTLPRRYVLLAAAGLVTALIGIVVHFPARVALAWFAPPGIVAWGTEGTIWQGRVAGILVRGHSLGSLSWDARPWAMLALRPTWDLNLRRADGFASGRVALSVLSGRQHIEGLEAALELGTLPPGLLPGGTSGQARLSLQRLEILDGWPASIAGRAAVTQLKLPGVIMPLGPFEFVFPEADGPPAGEINSLGGALEVAGRIDLPAPGEWLFSAELAPGENPPRELVDGLRFVGEDLGNGRRRLEMRSEP